MDNISLTKIHKGTSPPPGRPIVSSTGCPTARLSQFADFFLQPVVTESRSYIKDTTHFINILNELPTLPSGSLLVTLDVSSLYTNIPQLQGKQAIARALIKHRRNGTYPCNASIIQLLNLVLSLNNFTFNGDHYLQVGGTAMGTKVAPSYANLFMADFEDKFVYTYPDEPFLWLRFIDDIFMIWTHGTLSLDNFIAHLNKCLPSINFTHEISPDQVPFLDTMAINIREGKLITNLYCKPTDAHFYLHYSSAHPTSCKKGIPYGQFLRLCRICSRITEFDNNAVNLARHFSRCGYPQELIETSLIKARRRDRTELLQLAVPTNATKESTFYFITTHFPGPNSPRAIVEKNWSILARNRPTRTLYDAKIIYGKRRPHNLRDHLVTAKVKPVTKNLSVNQN